MAGSRRLMRCAAHRPHRCGMRPRHGNAARPHRNAAAKNPTNVRTKETLTRLARWNASPSSSPDNRWQAGGHTYKRHGRTVYDVTAIIQEESILVNDNLCPGTRQGWRLMRCVSTTVIRVPFSNSMALRQWLNPRASGSHRVSLTTTPEAVRPAGGAVPSAICNRCCPPSPFSLHDANVAPGGMVGSPVAVRPP